MLGALDLCQLARRLGTSRPGASFHTAPLGRHAHETANNGVKSRKISRHGRPASRGTEESAGVLFVVILSERRYSTKLTYIRAASTSEAGGTPEPERRNKKGYRTPSFRRAKELVRLIGIGVLPTTQDTSPTLTTKKAAEHITNCVSYGGVGDGVRPACAGRLCPVSSGCPHLCLPRTDPSRALAKGRAAPAKGGD